MSTRSVFYAFIFISILLFASFVIADPTEDLARGSFRTTYNPQTGKIDYYRMYNGSDFCLIDGTNCALGGGANSSITGSGSAGQVAFWSGPASVVGNANFSLQGTILRILTTVNVSRLLVGGVDVCLANGTNCIAVANGTNGVDGINGSQGPPGVDGLNGTNGINGTSVVNVTYLANGSMNVTLSNGVSFISPNLTGPQGAQGIQGETGATGSQGPAGQAGTNGTNGINGTGVANATVLANGSLQIGLTNGTIWILNNITGAKGDTGATGSQGPQGVQGETGAAGATGQAGLNGTNGTSVVNVTFFANGSMNVTLSNGIYFISPNLTGSKGSQGVQGETGATGATGQSGTNGTNGTGVRNATVLVNGSLQLGLTNGTIWILGNVTGAKGDQGIQGVQGDAGAAGAAGLNGTGIKNIYLLANGSLQINLTNGTNITTANITGATGPQGATGATGQAGTNGSNASVTSGDLYIDITNGIVGANITHFDLRYYLNSNPDSYTTLAAVAAAIQNATICHTDGTNCPPAGGGNSSWNESRARELFPTNGSSARFTTINATNITAQGLNITGNASLSTLGSWLTIGQDGPSASGTALTVRSSGGNGIDVRGTIVDANAFTLNTVMQPTGQGVVFGLQTVIQPQAADTTQYGVLSLPTIGENTLDIANVRSFYLRNDIQSGYNGTITNLDGLFIAGSGTPTNGSVTNTAAIRYTNSDAGTNKNRGIWGQTSAAANNWNLYLVGTAQNYLEGSLGVGVEIPTSKLHVVGDANITGKFVVGDLTTENCDLRVYRNGSLYCGEKWRNISTAATQTVSGTTFANVTGLAWHAKANTNYSMNCVIMWTTNVSTSGMRMTVEDWGGSVTSAKTAISLLGGATVRTDFLQQLGTGTVVTVAGISNTGINYPAYIDSTIVNGATPVTITVMFSGEAAGLAANITKGGWCDVKTLDG